MGKAKRIKKIRAMALGIKAAHPSDPRGPQSIARAIRRRGSSSGGATTETYAQGIRRRSGR